MSKRRKKNGPSPTKQRAANPRTKKASSGAKKTQLAANRKAQHELEPMEIHPLAADVPQMTDEEYAEFRADVEKNIRENDGQKDKGLTDPFIITYEGMILDGRHRDKVCRELGIPRKFKPYEGDDPAGFVVSENVRRRHLTDDQRVALVSKLLGPQLEAEGREHKQSGLKKGQQIPVSPKSGSREKATEKIAKTAGVTRYKAEQAEKARKAGVLDDVLEHGEKLRDAAKKAPKRTPKPGRKPRKVVSFEDKVYKKWSLWLNRFPQPQRREVIALVKGLIALSEDQMKLRIEFHQKWAQWFKRFESTKRDEVIELVKGWVGSDKTSDTGNQSAGTKGGAS